MLRSAAFSGTTGMWLASANEADPAAERVPDLLQARRGRHRVPAVIQELDDLPADLQLAQVAVQVEPVQALQVQRRRARPARRSTVTGTDRLIRDAMAPSSTWPTHGGCAHLHATRLRNHETSAVSGGACLGAC